MPGMEPRFTRVGVAEAILATAKTTAMALESMARRDNEPLTAVSGQLYRPYAGRELLCVGEAHHYRTLHVYQQLAVRDEATAAYARLPLGWSRGPCCVAESSTNSRDLVLPGWGHSGIR